MKKGKRKEEEEDDEETRSEEREAESISDGIEVYRKDLSQMTIDPARQEELATAKGGSTPLTEDQSDLVFQLACLGHSSDSIMEIMGTGDGAVDRVELGLVMKELEFHMITQGQPEGEHGSERLQTEIGTK